MGWIMAAEATARGSPREACRAALDWAEPIFEPTPIWAIIAPANEPSMKLAEKLGFERLGEAVYHDESDAGASGGRPGASYQPPPPPPPPPPPDDPPPPRAGRGRSGPDGARQRGADVIDEAGRIAPRTARSRIPAEALLSLGRGGRKDALETVGPMVLDASAIA